MSAARKAKDIPGTKTAPIFLSLRRRPRRWALCVLHLQYDRTSADSFGVLRIRGEALVPEDLAISAILLRWWAVALLRRIAAVTVQKTTVSLKSAQVAAHMFKRATEPIVRNLRSCRPSSRIALCVGNSNTVPMVKVARVGIGPYLMQGLGPNKQFSFCTNIKPFEQSHPSPKFVVG